MQVDHLEAMYLLLHSKVIRPTEVYTGHQLRCSQNQSQLKGISFTHKGG